MLIKEATKETLDDVAALKDELIVVIKFILIQEAR